MNGLHPATRRDHLDRTMYCGRFALMAATGFSAAQVTTGINLYRKEHSDKHVASTGVNDLTHALSFMGFNFMSERFYHDDKQATFTQWRKREQHGRNATYIVLITGHWIAVKGDWMVDTIHTAPVDLSRKNPYARKRVQAVIRITGA